MNQVDQFYQNHSLIVYWSGGMGTFLSVLLSSDYNHNKMNLKLSFEWINNDYYDHIKYYDSSKTVKYIRQFEEWFGKEQGAKKFFYFYRYWRDKQELMQEQIDEKINEKLELLTKDEVDDTLNNIPTRSNFISPYIQSHPWYVRNPGTENEKIFNYFSYAVKDFPWKQKIFCYFPREKQWIQHFFIFHKIILRIFSDSFMFKRSFNNFTMPTPSVMFGDKFFSDDFPGFFKLNMYDLIFKRDVSELKQICPEIETDEVKQNILNIAQATSMAIFDSLGLDHTKELDVSDLSEVLKFFRSQFKGNDRLQNYLIHYPNGQGFYNLLKRALQDWS